MHSDKDIFGRKIEVGDFVAYAVAQRSAPLCYGRVLKKSVSGSNQYFHILGACEDCEWVDRKKVVLGYQLNNKPGRVLGGNRLLVVNDYMPDNIKKLYA